MGLYIEPLATHFLHRIRPSALPLLPATLAHLQALPWVGNVRELRNALEHAAILAREGPLLPEHFPLHSAESADQNPTEVLTRAVRRWLVERIRQAGNAPTHLYDDLLQLIEPALLGEVMRRLDGNRWAASQWLGLNRATVRKKLTAYGLESIGDEDTVERDENVP